MPPTTTHDELDHQHSGAPFPSSPPRETLDAAGHKVKAVGDLAKATEALAEQPFDVILMDLMMPRKSPTLKTGCVRNLP